MKSRLLLLMLLLCSLLPAGAETRLAILADDSAQPVADLLAARLSGEKELVLVERTELDKVMREANLPARGNLQQSLAAAGLVHANGIVILESRKAGDKTVFGARLVACAPGVVIAAGIFGGSSNEAVEAMSRRFQPLWNKLDIARGDAVPVSILNLRCALKGSEALENQLTFLLAHQLTQQPKLFILERSRMDDLLMEKENDEPFWTGSRIVDGRIESTPEGRIIVKVFLHSPDHDPAQSIEASGSQDNLSPIINELAKHIGTKLLGQPSATEWKGAEEGAEYLKEAKWAFGARLYPAARSAVEAAWALGERNPELHRLRLQIYSALAFPPSPPRFSMTAASGYHRDAIDVTQSNEPLRAAFQALGCFEDCVRVSKTGKPEGREANLGGMALLAASRVLRNYHERGLVDNEDLPELRRKAREAASVLFDYSTEHSQKPYYYDIGGQGGYASFPHHDIEAVYLPYWYDTPREALKAWRTCLERPYQSWQARSRLVYRFLLEGSSDERGAPYLVGWHGESDEQLKQLWEGFIQMLSESADPRESLDGALLQVYAATESKDREAAMIRYCERLWEKRDVVVKNEWGRNYIILLDQFFPSRWAEEQQYPQRWLSFYLQNATTFDSVFLRFAFGHLKNNDAFLDLALFQQWQSYKDRLSAAGKLSDRIRSSCREREAEFFRPYLQPDPNVPAIPSVQVTQRWTPKPSEGTIGRKLVWQENLLWVVLGKRNDKIESEKQCYKIRICALAVPSFAVAQTIETPVDLAITESAPEFFLTPGSLFLKDGNRFHRYNRKQGTWSTLPLPDYPYNRILARGGELIAGFGGDEKGVVRWSEATQKVEILASSRRRPATPADEHLAYTAGGFFGGEKGKFGVILSYMGKTDGFYWFDPATGKCESPFRYFPAGYKVLSGSNALLISRQCGVAIIANETGAMTQFPGSHFEKDTKDAPPVQLPEAFNSLPNKQLGISIMPALAYGEHRLWTLRTRSDEMGRSLLLNRCERLDQAPSASPDIRLVFQPQNHHPDAPSPINPVALQMPGEAAFSVVATTEGLVIRIHGTDGLWWMAYRDFETALAPKAP